MLNILDVVGVLTESECRIEKSINRSKTVLEAMEYDI